MVWINLKKELSKAMNRAGISEEIHATDIVESSQQTLREVFPSEIINEVEIVYYKDAVLALRVTSSVIAQEVKLREKTFIDSLNKLFKKEIITHLRIMT